MPRKLPPLVERWRDRHGKMRHYFRKGKGARFPLPWSRDGRVRSGLQAALMGQLVAKRCAESEVIAATRSVDIKTLRRARFSIASPDARHSACQKRSVASCPASIFQFQSFGLGRALCGAPSFGIQGRPASRNFPCECIVVRPAIGHPLDTVKVFRPEYLISLALPRGFQHCFRRERAMFTYSDCLPDSLQHVLDRAFRRKLCASAGAQDDIHWARPADRKVDGYDRDRRIGTATAMSPSCMPMSPSRACARGVSKASCKCNC